MLLVREGKPEKICFQEGHYVSSKSLNKKSEKSKAGELNFQIDELMKLISMYHPLPLQTDTVFWKIWFFFTNEYFWSSNDTDKIMRSELSILVSRLIIRIRTNRDRATSRYFRSEWCRTVIITYWAVCCKSESMMKISTGSSDPQQIRALPLLFSFFILLFFFNFSFLFFFFFYLYIFYFLFFLFFFCNYLFLFFSHFMQICSQLASFQFFSPFIILSKMACL